MKEIEHQRVITPCRRIEGELRVPGDKSIAHRALSVSLLASGPVDVVGLPAGADVGSTLAAVQGLISPNSIGKRDLETRQLSTSPRDFQVTGKSAGWAAIRSPEEPIDVGNSGTTIRLLLGILAGTGSSAILTGDDSIRRRPMARVVDPLRRMGATIEYLGQDGLAPLRVSGTDLHGTDHDLPVASAQVKSALLFAGLRATGSTSVLEPHLSRDHTERMLRHLGAPIDISTGRCIISSIELLSGVSIRVPGDISSAAFPLVAAALLPESRVTVSGVGVNPTRTGILDVLRAYGATVEVDGIREECGEPVGTVTVTAGDRRPVEVAGADAVATIDELPLVAVLGAFAEGLSVVRDAAELRVKESDRIAAVVGALKGLGVDIEATPDGFVVRGHGGIGTAGGSVSAHGDHRIAMTLAVAALAAREGETLIDGWGSVGISYPGFSRDLDALVVR